MTGLPVDANDRCPRPGAGAYVTQRPGVGNADTQPGCEHAEPDCIQEPGCRCPRCLMMEGYLIVMRRVAALRRSGHSDDCSLLQRDALYRVIRAVCTCGQAAKPREAKGNEEYAGRHLLLDTLAENLRRLTEEGGGHNYVILVADEAKNYFVQFGTSCGSAVIYGEAVGDRYLHPPFTLTRAQRKSLLSLGWHPPTRRKYPNFWRHWPVITAPDRSAIADVALATLKAVYGWQGGPLQVRLHLDW